MSYNYATNANVELTQQTFFKCRDTESYTQMNADELEKQIGQLISPYIQNDKRGMVLSEEDFNWFVNSYFADVHDRPNNDPLFKVARGPGSDHDPTSGSGNPRRGAKELLSWIENFCWSESVAVDLLMDEAYAIAFALQEVWKKTDRQVIEKFPAVWELALAVAAQHNVAPTAATRDIKAEFSKNATAENLMRDFFLHQTPNSLRKWLARFHEELHSLPDRVYFGGEVGGGMLQGLQNSVFAYSALFKDFGKVPAECKKACPGDIDMMADDPLLLEGNGNEHIYASLEHLLQRTKDAFLLQRRTFRTALLELLDTFRRYHLTNNALINKMQGDFRDDYNRLVAANIHKGSSDIRGVLHCSSFHDMELIYARLQWLSKVLFATMVSRTPEGLVLNDTDSLDEHMVAHLEQVANDFFNSSEPDETKLGALQNHEELLFRIQFCKDIELVVNNTYVAHEYWLHDHGAAIHHDVGVDYSNYIYEWREGKGDDIGNDNDDELNIPAVIPHGGIVGVGNRDRAWGVNHQ